MLKRTRTRIGSLVIAGAAAYCGLAPIGSGQRTEAQAATRPNIIFVIIDDTGVDQFELYGFGGTLPARMPNLAKIAERGVKFTNVWSMPECSPSRAAFFTGRYPIRSGVESAIVPPHLPQAHVSQYAATLPRVLSKAGYVSALIGKVHLGDDPDPGGTCAPLRRGFDHYSGMRFGSPTAIDKTAGGGDPSGGQVCGYFQTSSPGACYTQKDGATKCKVIDAGNADPNTTPSRTCLQNGGLFRPNTACGDSVPTADNFTKNNGYYVWLRQAMSGARRPDWVPTSDTLCGATQSREYMDEKNSDDGAAWWNRQTGPRMLTVSYGGMHTPLQKGPTNIVADRQDSAATCSSLPAEPPVLKSMLETLDVSIGRMLADIGLGTLDAQGRKLTSLNLSNTMVVIVGDNGSFAGTVRVTDGFSFSRSKASVYQTGVWVPLIVAGPMVSKPGRDVDELINVTDLFGLFGNIAGLDVNEVVPPSQLLDSKSMMPYLASPNAPAVRETNFTQGGVGALTPVPEERSWPCLVAPQCTDTVLFSQALCEDNGGTWFGPGGATQVTSCCAVVAQNSAFTIIPPAAYATRNKRFKLVELQQTNCAAPLGANDEKLFPWQEYKVKAKREFYDISRTPTNPTGMDVADADMLLDCPDGQDPSTCLPRALRPEYAQLSNALANIKDSATAQKTCRALGDGNLDMRVNNTDIDQWKVYKGNGPSQYDINMDGETDDADRAIIEANLGTDCMDICQRADLDRNGRVDGRDMTLLVKQNGTCDPVLCSGDLNGDGIVNGVDLALMINAQNTCSAPKPRSASTKQ